MILFAGNKIIRQTGIISATEISIGERIEKECFNVVFNDNTNAVVPHGTKILLHDDNLLEVKKPQNRCFWGTKSKYKVKTIIPDFTQVNLDPYIIGVAICTPVRNKTLKTKKEIFLEKDKIPAEYYSLNLKKVYGGYYNIIPDEGYPNLLRLDIKKQGNFKNLAARFIPDEYLYSCFDNRVALLRGCMDTLGHYYKGETTFETCSYQLSKDVSFLILSLGGVATTRIKKSKNDYFIVSMSFRDEFNPFLLKSGFVPSARPRIRCITKIESVGNLPCFEIPLDKVILNNLVVAQ